MEEEDHLEVVHRQTRQQRAAPGHGHAWPDLEQAEPWSGISSPFSNKPKKFASDMCSYKWLLLILFV